MRFFSCLYRQIFGYGPILALLEAGADGPGTLVADLTRTRICDRRDR
jgi:hypothetical protein